MAAVELRDAEERRHSAPACWRETGSVLAGRNRLKYSYVWAFLGQRLSLVVGFGFKNQPRVAQRSQLCFHGIVLHTVFKLWLTSEACHRSTRPNVGALELAAVHAAEHQGNPWRPIAGLQRQSPGRCWWFWRWTFSLLLACIEKSPAQDKQLWGCCCGGKLTVFVLDWWC